MLTPLPEAGRHPDPMPARIPAPARLFVGGLVFHRNTKQRISAPAGADIRALWGHRDEKGDL